MAVDPADPLLQSVGIPREVDVHHGGCELEVAPLLARSVADEIWSGADVEAVELALESVEVCLVVEVSSHKPRSELPVEFISDGCGGRAMHAEHHGLLGCHTDVGRDLRQPRRTK